MRFFGYFRCRKHIHAEHLFSEFANLLAHYLLHRALLRMSNPAHFGRKEEFFEVGEREDAGRRSISLISCSLFISIPEKVA